MLDWVWFFLLAIGVLCGAASGNLQEVTDSAFAAAQDAVMLCFNICGLLCLWLGIFRIAEASGLVNKLGKLIAPFVKRLFPDIPAGHPAMAAIVMNVSANLLGLGNAATPFGLKAMEELQTLNPNKDTASTPMITFLVMNTSCITLIPTLVISLRTAAGSVDPARIIMATTLSSAIGLISGLLIDRFIRKRVT